MGELRILLSDATRFQLEDVEVSGDPLEFAVSGHVKGVDEDILDALAWKSLRPLEIRLGVGKVDERHRDPAVLFL